MGKVIERRLVAVRCERHGCRGAFACPGPADASWWDLRAVLAERVSGGWAFVCLPRLRSYCPEHAREVTACSCRGRAGRMASCPVHSVSAREAIWSRDASPMGAGCGGGQEPA